MFALILIGLAQCVAKMTCFVVVQWNDEKKSHINKYILTLRLSISKTDIYLTNDAIKYHTHLSIQFFFSF